jgi:thiamine-phosphate pyrophosphorylase
VTPAPWSPPRLYAIADLELLGADRLPAAVGEMAAVGVRWIQVRAKGATGALAYRLLAESLRAIGDGAVELWVNDRVDLAAMLPVAGVHLGRQDLPPRLARPLLASGQRIGRSTHDVSQIAAAAADPAVEVVAVGPVFPTRSKRNPDPVVGLELLREARRLTDKPLVAIGGIDAENLASVLAAGADSAAVLSAACAGDVTTSCRRLLQSAERALR